MSNHDNTDNSKKAESLTNSNVSVTRQNSFLNEDIHDSPQDEEKMKSEIFIIDLPDVSDIPGQENIVIPVIGEMQDTTISSDDEEGFGLFDDDEVDEDTDLVMGNDADVTADERYDLTKADEEMPEEDNDSLSKEAELDTTDNEGDALNEGSLGTNVSGDDLDIPGADADDAMEAIGEEDEENNDYSLGSDSNDNVTEGTP